MRHMEFGLKKLPILLAAILSATSALAQDAPPGNTSPPLLQKPYETLRDFFNYFATADYSYDNNAGYLIGGGHGGGASGLQVGGGASAFHNWQKSTFSLYYRGNFRDYLGVGHADDQMLLATYQRRFKRWAIDVNESGALLNEQGAVYAGGGPAISSPSLLVQSNSFSSGTKYESTQVSATYNQNYRLSYTFSGNYMINGYTRPYPYRYTDTGGMVAVNYRLARRTTVSGTYNHSIYSYTRGFGSNNVDSIYASLAHTFADRIDITVSAGGTRAAGSGAVVFPLTGVVNGQLVTVFGSVRYQTTNYFPYYSLTATKQFNHTTLYITGAEAVTPGNGQFLTSRTLELNGYASQQFRRSNLTIGSYYSRIAGVVSAVGFNHSTTLGGNFGYSYNLFRHVGVNTSYSYLRISNSGFQTRPDQRVSLGLFFESKDIPLGLY